MSVTLESAVQATVTALTAAAINTGDGALLVVTDFDPMPGEVLQPGHASVTFGSMDPVGYNVVVRLYASTLADVRAAEVFTRATVPAVDVALNAVNAPRSDWAKTFSPEWQAYVTETTLSFGREDF